MSEDTGPGGTPESRVGGATAPVGRVCRGRRGRFAGEVRPVPGLGMADHLDLAPGPPATGGEAGRTRVRGPQRIGLARDQ
jgi:hypothetical protein